jgi:hypothetical protein
VVGVSFEKFMFFSEKFQPPTVELEFGITEREGRGPKVEVERVRMATRSYLLISYKDIV